jgi:uncharacterized membrane protein HdeD (DUF308 family)
MSSSQTDIERIERAALSALHDHWVLFLVEGIVLLVLGAVAIIVPPLATLAFTIFFGWLLFISGVVGLVTTFWLRRAPGFWWSLLSAVLGIVAGLALIGWPVRGALSLTIVLVAFFIIEGIASIMFSLEHKREMAGRWGWMLVSGVIDLLLALMIFAGLPSTAAWAIGLLIGINMIFGGTALIAMALHARGSAT